MALRISLTTILPRFGGIGAVLERLLRQGAASVVLVLPERWTRFPGHHAPPDMPSGVTVLRAQDIGPASKVLPVRAAFPGDDIVYCDNDCLYEPGWLDALRRSAGRSQGGFAATIHAASVFDVRRLRRRGRLVAQGFGGVLVPAGVPLPDHIPSALRDADDLWLSAWWEAHGVAIAPVPAARRAVRPLDRACGLQDNRRASVYRDAADEISRSLGVWPPIAET